MINTVILNGRLTEDCYLNYTSNGKAVGNFKLAVNRDFTNQAGEREADFILCVIWGKPAETFANYTRKGSLVSVQGRLQSRSYENQQGQKVYVTEVVIEHFDFLESKDQLEHREQKRQQNNGPAMNQNQQPNNPPMNQNQQNYANAAQNIANSQQQQQQQNYGNGGNQQGNYNQQ